MFRFFFLIFILFELLFRHYIVCGETFGSTRVLLRFIATVG